MQLDHIPSGQKLPHDINVIIEIAANSLAVKYELDKNSGALFVDRFIATSMNYPCNYGFIPHTLAQDGDPVDVLVITPLPLISGAVIRCRPVGMLAMTDESGLDAKILAVPVSQLSKRYDKINGPSDLSPHLLAMIEHFFEHYKDLEAGKWVKIDKWYDVNKAHQVIIEAAKRAEQ